MPINLLPINLGLTLVLLVVTIWQFLRISRLNQIRKHFYSQGLKKNLEQIVVEQDQSIHKLNENLDQLGRLLQELTENNKNNYQRLGFVRFSPFGEAGNLSFALTLLDAHNNGFVLSSFHGREGTRIYSKDIRSGKSKAKLTDEETESLKQAVETLNPKTNGEKRNS